MSTISTHVLDTALGRPAAGVRVTLQNAQGSAIGSAVTDADGRARDFAGTLLPGSYRLRFDVVAYFRETEGGRECFYDDVVVSFHIDGTGHFHVPLLLSPFGYTTYRGS
jgi:5-hydroxyisourate hydrolase